MLRFCRARKFVLADVQLMWKNHMDWRVKKDVDNLYLNFKFEEADKVHEVYPMTYHKTCKIGRPVYIERLGSLVVDNLWKVTTEERMWNNYITSFEKLLNFRYKVCTELKGSRVESSLSIVDMTGFGMSMMSSKVKQLLQAASAVTGDNYPENMGAMYVVNAPFVFSAAWSMVKGFLDERT